MKAQVTSGDGFY